MKRKYLLLLASAAALVGTSCVNSIDDDDTIQEVRTLYITTRNATSLPYPIRLYAFRPEDGKQVATTIINNEEDGCSLNLPEGAYHLVALAGTGNCTVPANPELTSAITLPTENCATEGLMLGSADITLKAADAEADITLGHRMARIALALDDVPPETSAVKIRFSPLHRTMNFNGIYASEGGRTEVTCTREGDAWKTPAFYTFPGSGQALTLSIELTATDGTTKTYGYLHTERLEAGTPYSLTESYKKGFTVNGKITADDWGMLKEIKFTFGDESSSNPDEGNTPGDGSVIYPDANGYYTVTTLPTARNLWNGHYVAAVQNKAADSTSADLLILSLKEWQDVASAKTKTVARQMEATDYVAAYTEAEATGWSIPTSEEVKLIKSNCAGILLSDANTLLTSVGGDVLTGNGNDSHGSPVRYLCENATYSYELKGLTGSVTTAGDTRTYYLRAVKILHVRRAQ
ncbi:MAG: FimB/Mfa2 family fimbrial subunit [Bacteroides sp.]|nr:FimB/Mfa2 family fimbrial subunit [Bacteroides sp.]